MTQPLLYTTLPHFVLSPIVSSICYWVFHISGQRVWSLETGDGDLLHRPSVTVSAQISWAERIPVSEWDLRLKANVLMQYGNLQTQISQGSICMCTYMPAYTDYTDTHMRTSLDSSAGTWGALSGGFARVASVMYAFSFICTTDVLLPLVAASLPAYELKWDTDAVPDPALKSGPWWWSVEGINPGSLHWVINNWSCSMNHCPAAPKCPD